MEWSVADSRDGDLEIPAANYPNIRLITVATEGSQTPLDRFRRPLGTSARPKTIPQFSAVGYFFGRDMLQDRQGADRPDRQFLGRLGVRGLDSPRSDGRQSALRRLLAEWDKKVAGFDEKQARRRVRQASLPTGKRKADGARQRSGAPEPPDKPWWNNPLTGQFRPANLYNGRLKPIMPYAIRGVIWYQGETNADRAYQYREMFPLMIKNWRDDWGQGDFPFYWVQLADFMPEDRPAGRQRLGRAARSADDDARQVAAHRPGGDHRPGRGERHPSEEQAGRRPAAGTAGARQDRSAARLPHDSPRYKSMYKQGDTILIRFKDVNGRLKTVDGKPVTGFAIAGVGSQMGLGRREDRRRQRSRSPQRQGPRSVRGPLRLGGQPGVQSDRRGRPAGDAVPHGPWPGVTADKSTVAVSDAESPASAGSKTAAS